jgi:hypothetical protein
VTEEVIKLLAQLDVAAKDAVVAKLALVTELVMKFNVQLDVPNNDPVKPCTAVTEPDTTIEPDSIKDPDIVG